ncbi:MAG: oligosaccharide flippase family protein [Pseudomonadota bacterium]
MLFGAGLSVALRCAGIGLSYVANIMLSRLLGAQDFGRYVIALGWALVLTLPARAGFEHSSLRFATVYFEQRQSGLLRGFFRTAFTTVVVLSLLIGCVMAAAGWSASSFSIVAGAAIILPIAALGVASPMLRAAQRIMASQLYDQIVRPAVLILGIGLAVLAGRRMSVEGALLLTAFAALAALAALLVEFRSVFAPATRAPADYAEWRRWFALSVPMLLIASMQELMNQMEVILLGHLATATDAGLFAAAWRLASLTPFALAALTGIAGPQIASSYHRGALDELSSLSRLIARIGLLIAIGAAALLVLFGRPLLGLFGPGFDTAYPVLVALTIGGLVNAFTGVVAYMMTLTGRERPALAIFAGALAISVLFNLLLIPRFGALGAAIASSSATAAWNLAMLVYVRRTLGIDASALALARRERA